MKSKWCEHEKPIFKRAISSLATNSNFLILTYLQQLANDDIVSILHNEVIVHSVMMYADPLVIV